MVSPMVTAGAKHGRTTRSRQPDRRARKQVFLRRQPRSAELHRAGPPAPGRRRHLELADRPAAGRLDEPRRRARRSTTSTAPSTSTCTAATARRSPATRIRRSSPRCPTGSAAAPTSRSRPRTRSGSPRELARRFDLPLWRFANSGTEATMDAVHLMRALTGRDLIIKVEGCYHGHHDSVQVSVLPDADEIGPRERPTGVAGNTGIPQAIRDLVVVVPFNDLAAVERVLDENARPGRRHDPRAGDDERRDHPARAGLPRRAARTAAPARRAADLRRGQDRLHHRPGRRDRALRRRPGHRLPGQGARRRHRGRGDRRHRGR